MNNTPNRHAALPKIAGEVKKKISSYAASLKEARPMHPTQVR